MSAYRSNPMDGQYGEGWYGFKGVLIGVDKIVHHCIVVVMYIFGVGCLIKLDGEGFGYILLLPKDSVFLSDDFHVNSMVSVNSDINNL